MGIARCCGAVAVHLLPVLTMRTLATVTLVVVAAWGAYAQWAAPRTPAIPLASLQNAIVAERLAERDAPVLLLGSSLAARVPLDEVDTGAIAAGVSGGSAADAVLLAQALGRRPRVAIVEVNRLSWLAQGEAMRALADSARSRLPWRAARTEFRPSTQVIGRLVQISEAVRDRLRAKTEPGTVPRVVGGVGDAVDDTVTQLAALTQMRTALDQWSASGTRVFLVRLPTDGMTALDSAADARADRLLPPSLFPRLDVGPGPWPTTDGRHLTVRAARRAAERIGAAIRAGER